MTRRRFVPGAVLAFATVVTFATGGGGALTQGTRKSVTASSVSASYQWGVPLPNGLQLGAQIARRGGQESSLVHCLIRNHGPGDAQYNDYFLGNGEKVQVWARPVNSASWVKLERDPAAPGILLGVGPGSRHHTLRPGEMLLWRSKTIAKGDALHYTIDYLPSADDKPTPASVKNVNYMPYTFAVPLDNLVWPAAWKGPVELQVVHTLLANGKLTTKKDEQFKLTYQPVHSGSVTISANMVRVLRLPRNKHLVRGYVPPVRTTKATGKKAGP